MPARKGHEQRRARELREAGWPLRRIASELGVSLSSASVWTRQVEQPPREPLPVAPAPRSAPERLRRWSRCRSLRPLSSFSRHGNGHQWWCRGCFREYYRERESHHRDRSNALKARRVAEASGFVLAYLRTHPCVACGEADPVVLEFDHLARKRSEVSTLIRRGVRIPVLEREMAACQVVCAVCHRRRTARRGRWRRLDPDQCTRSWRSERQRRNVLYAYGVLEASGCVDCGEDDLTVLDFDHVQRKRAGVMRLAYAEAGLGRLREEIDRCEVRCVLCHRRRTALASAYYRTLEVPPARVELALPA